MFEWSRLTNRPSALTWMRLERKTELVKCHVSLRQHCPAQPLDLQSLPQQCAHKAQKCVIVTCPPRWFGCSRASVKRSGTYSEAPESCATIVVCDLNAKARRPSVGLETCICKIFTRALQRHIFTYIAHIYSWKQVLFIQWAWTAPCTSLDVIKSCFFWEGGGHIANGKRVTGWCNIIPVLFW